MIAADIERIARRRGTISISALAAEVYRERPAPKRPDVTVKTVLCEMRRRGVPVHIHWGHVTIGRRAGTLPLKPGPWVKSAGLPLSPLDWRVLSVLTEWAEMPLSLADIADEIGYASGLSGLRQVLRRLVAKGHPIDCVGRLFRLARCAP